MQKIYCICGTATYFEVKKPNVCSNCAKPFNAAFVKPIEKAPPPAVIKAKKVVEDDDDWEDEEEEDNEEVNLRLSAMKKLAKASARKVTINMSKKLKMEDLKNVSEKIERQIDNSPRPNFDTE